MFGGSSSDGTPEFDLHDTLLRKQDVLVSSLGGLRGALKHKGGSGDAREGEWKDVIENFLPRRYCVAGKTEVIDHLGNTSQQQDLVIFDRHFCPLFFEEHGLTRIPAESVFAVFEVKPSIDKGMIDYAMEKATSVRALARTEVAITDKGVVKAPRGPFEIVAGILGLESEWNPPFGGPFEKSLEYEDPNQRLHLGCALKHGAFEVVYDDAAGASTIEAAGEGSLMFFLLRLFARLQLIGSPMAIDLRAYSRSLEVPLDQIVASEG